MKKMERSILAVSLIIAAAACSASDPRLPPPATDPGTTGPVNTGDIAGPSAGETTAGAAGAGTGAGAGTAAGAAGAGAAYGGSDAARLAIRLVDAPSDQVTSIFVTLAKVDALLPSGWTTIVEKEQGIDLLTLQNGQFLALGLAALPPGRVGQLRLHLTPGGDHHVVTPDGVTHPLSVPSGEASGIKLVGGFDVPACGDGQVTMDFDGKRSLQVISSGKNAGQWSMRPVIRLKSVVTHGACSDAGAAPDGDAGASSSGDAATDGREVPDDPCANVTCADTETCQNGTCQTSQ
jgi:hypothetical protein